MEEWEQKFKITTKALFGCVLLAVGLVFLVYVTFNVLLLANGAVQPMKLNFNVSNENQVLMGLVTQLGSYVLLVVVAAIFMANGVALIRN